jgi:hypothetical protein
MSAIPRKIVIKGRKLKDDGNAAYQKQRKAERLHRQLLFQLLLHWGRGFNLADAPPESNEWTRRP